MTKNKASKVAEKFNVLYFTTSISESVQPAFVEEDKDGDCDVIICASDSRIISHSAMRSAWKVCSMYHLMMFVFAAYDGLRITIHS